MFVFYTRCMKIKSTIIVLAFSLLFASVPLCSEARTPSCSATWYELYNRATDEFDAQNYADAENIAHEAMHACGDSFCQSFLTLDLLETAAERQSNYKRAEKYLVQSLQLLKRNNFMPRRILGLVYLKMSMVNYYKKDYHRAGFYALLAVPALEESCEEEEYSVISANKAEQIKHKTQRILRFKRNAHKTGANSLKSLDFDG